MSKHWKGIISKLTPDQLLNIATIEQTEQHELKQDERRAIGKNLTARGHSLFSRFDPAKLELATKLRLNTSSWREEYNDTRYFSSAFFSVLFCFCYCCFSHWKRLEGNVQFHSVHMENLLSASTRWTRPIHKYAQSIILPATSNLFWLFHELKNPKAIRKWSFAMFAQQLRF